MRSAPSFRPQRRSSSSFSESAGTFTATPGRLMPLLFDTGPATMTSVRTRTPSVSSTLTFTLPSSISRKSPGFTSAGSPLKVVLQISFVPRMSSVVIVKMSPSASSCGPFSNMPRRIFGPCRSTSTATGLPASAAACRTLR